jgi:uncharacterized protein (TIGR03067 family)
MRTLRFVPILMALLSPHVASGEETAVMEMEKLQGEWKGLSLAHEGRAISLMDGWGWTVAGREVRLRYSPTPSQAAFVADPKQSPKTLDLTSLEGKEKGLVSPCIYKFEGERLIVCARIPSSKQGRPTEFKSEPGSESGLITLERVKK